MCSSVAARTLHLKSSPAWSLQHVSLRGLPLSPVCTETGLLCALTASALLWAGTQSWGLAPGWCLANACQRNDPRRGDKQHSVPPSAPSPPAAGSCLVVAGRPSSGQWESQDRPASPECCGDLGVVGPQLDKPPEAGNPPEVFPPSPASRQGFTSGGHQKFRWLDMPAPPHSRKAPPTPAPLSLHSVRSHTLGPCVRSGWQAASLCWPSPALTAAWHLYSGLRSSLELPRL